MDCFSRVVRPTFPGGGRGPDPQSPSLYPPMISAPIVQALISVQALVFDLAQLTCQKRFDYRNAILGSSAILLGTSYSQIVVAVLL